MCFPARVGVDHAAHCLRFIQRPFPCIVVQSGCLSPDTQIQRKMQSHPRGMQWGGMYPISDEQARHLQTQVCEATVPLLRSYLLPLLPVLFPPPPPSPA